MLTAFSWWKLRSKLCTEYLKITTTVYCPPLLNWPREQRLPLCMLAHSDCTPDEHAWSNDSRTDGIQLSWFIDEALQTDRRLCGWHDTWLHGFMTLETMTNKLNHMVQTWGKILFYSGGALNLTKCSWHVLYWDWKNGRPVARPITTADSNLELSTHWNAEITHQITKRLPLDKPSRLLGVHLSSDGNFSDQILILKDKADKFAIRLPSPKITPQDIMTFHQTTYAPSVRYILPTLALD